MAPFFHICLIPVTAIATQRKIHVGDRKWKRQRTVEEQVRHGNGIDTPADSYQNTAAGLPGGSQSVKSGIEFPLHHYFLLPIV